MIKENSNNTAVLTQKKSTLQKKIEAEYFLSEVNIEQFKDNQELDEFIEEAAERLQQLNPKGPVQMMLASQMLSVHTMQQRMMVRGNNNFVNLKQQPYYVNSVIKLSNLFVAQASLYHKLQSEEQQGLPKEVHVHDGGQAVVGTINCYRANDNAKNQK